MKKFAIIVAGGSGTRMQSEVPKQFLLLGGKPLLFHTLEKFSSFPDIEIILVLPKYQIATWDELCRRYGFTVKHMITEGGETRFHSVKNGLSQIHSEGLVAVHDGVRPLVSKGLISLVFEEAEKNGNAVPGTPVRESMRSVWKDLNVAADRNRFRLIQTPQCFTVSVLQKAFEQSYVSTFTDEASVAESAGTAINLIQGETRNLKITTPDDLAIAEALIVQVNKS